MKKILLTLGTTAAIIAPITSIVACSSTKNTKGNPKVNPPKHNSNGGVESKGTDWYTQTKPIIKTSVISTPWVEQTKPIIKAPVISTPWVEQTKPIIKAPVISTPWSSMSDSWAPMSSINEDNVINKSQPVTQVPSLNASEQTLSKFTVSEITEDARMGNGLVDVDDTPRTFKVFDNGIFKIKFEKTLIGTNKFFADDSKAALEAKYIIQAINVGPAASHLEKGIQILESTQPTSLGGEYGVQLSLTNANGSSDDTGLKTYSALVAHEYGHHETLWDLHNIMGVNIYANPKSTQKNFQELMVKGLRDAGYPSIADEAAKYSPAGVYTQGFTSGKASDYPTAYGQVDYDNDVFADFDYPFDPAEVATRLLNILSFRDDLSPQDMYKSGGHGLTTSGFAIGIAADLTSDATLRKFTGDSVFGQGKDNSRITKLIDFYMKEVFGLGKATLGLEGDIRTSNHIDTLNLNSFGATKGLDKIEIEDGSGNVIKSVDVASYKSKFGFKNELLSSAHTINFNEDVQSVDELKIDLDISSDTFKIVGRDSSNNKVDLSGVEFKGVYYPDGGIQFSQTKLSHSGKDIVFDPNK